MWKGQIVSLKLFTLHFNFFILGLFALISLDHSQSPIFSWHCLDIPRLTVTGILIFKCTEGVGVEDYSSGGGAGEGREK